MTALLPSIWWQGIRPDADALNRLGADCMQGLLGIEVTDVADDALTGRMPVNSRTHQPWGRLHGGASIVLAETLGSLGAVHTLDQTRFMAVGMEINANQQYQEKLSALETRLQSVQQKLGELQGKKGEANRLVASPEVTKAIEDFQKQQAAMRGERREIRRALREDIDRLENRLLVLNLLTGPVLIGLFGVWFARSRKK